jgi:hypothetical protein
LFPATQAVDFVPPSFGRWWLLVLLAFELWSFFTVFSIVLFSWFLAETSSAVGRRKWSSGEFSSGGYLAVFICAFL